MTLEICEAVYSIRNRMVAKKAFLAKQPVFVLTDLDLDENENIVGDMFHCRLFLNPKDSDDNPEDISEIALFFPHQDGTESSHWFPIR